MGASTPAQPDHVTRHLRWGWVMLLTFATVGIALEALHGFKIGWYLDVGSESRRLMFRLGHAHGTLLALVNLGFAFTVDRMSQDASGWTFASRALRAGSVLMPAGFVLGGLFVYSGDPGLGVLLVPLGAFALVAAIGRVAWATLQSR